jgi:uncharacterized membrane protein YczE
MMKKSTPVQYLIRGLIYCVGLLILAFGVTFAVNSNLGVSPVTSVPYVISLLANISLGTCTTLVYCFYILLQIPLQGGKFHPALVLEIVFSTVFGWFVDGVKLILGDFCLPTYFGQLGMLAISIVLIALGLVLYIDVKIAPMPPEGLVTCIADKLGKPFPKIKTLFDCASVLAGLTLCFLFLGKVVGIREGTIITALLVGKLTGFFRKLLTPFIRKVCFED